MILDLNNNNKIDLIDADQSNVTLSSFRDMHGMNQMGWVQPGDGILVYDYQGDGKVTHIDEIALTFHSEAAKTDLEALRLAFDTNKDGIIDAKDEKFDQFGVWQDANSDGKTQHGEYQTLSQMGIISINLNLDHEVQMIEDNTVFGYTNYQTADGASHLTADVSLSVVPATRSVSLNEPDVFAEHDSINFNNLLSTGPTLPLQASERAIDVTAQNPGNKGAAEAFAMGLSVEIQHINQQLQTHTQEHQ